jgi:hypothetical protein
MKLNTKHKVEIEIEPLRYPYAARVDFILGEDIELALDYPVSLLTSGNCNMQMRLSPDQPMGPLQHLKKVRILIEGYSTAGEAEAGGLQLSLALLWAAVSKRFTMRLDYHTPLPCIVYNRTAPTGGDSMRAFGRSYWPLSVHEFSELLEELMVNPITVDRQLLLSMELYAASKLELSERAKFISLVSSLEPLAVPAEYPYIIEEMITDFCKQVKGMRLPELKPDEATRLRDSLEGRLRELTRESIRQAILRIIRELLPGDDKAIDIIDNAYALRSNILHGGVSDPYLDRKVSAVEDIIRRLYAARIGKPLKVAPLNIIEGET